MEGFVSMTRGNPKGSARKFAPLISSVGTWAKAGREESKSQRRGRRMAIFLGSEYKLDTIFS